jgi:pimeloyl-ACP methyl ester carboxylesterase
VVFTHAWGLRSDEFHYQVPALTAAGLRCVLYDRRGHGRSGRPATGYDLDSMAGDLAAVIGHFDLHEATLVDHPLGSKEAIRYLTRHGEAGAGHGLYASDHDALNADLLAYINGEGADRGDADDPAPAISG